MQTIPTTVWLTSQDQLDTSGLEPAILTLVRRQLEAKVRLTIVPGDGNITIVLVLNNTDDKEYKKLEAARNSGAAVCNTLNSWKIAEAVLSAPGIPPQYVHAFAEGLLLASYQFDEYLQKTAEKRKKTFSHLNIPEEYLPKDAQRELNIMVDAVFLTRDLVNMPLNYLGAQKYAGMISDLGKENGFNVTVFDKKKIEELKMGGILAVNRGSVADPAFIIMEYKPEGAKNSKPLVLVGKGVMYDTGGLSLKPTQNSMDYMKCDMAGSAAVVGGIVALAKTNAPVHVIGLIPAVENRPGGDAFTPGDVITHYDGTTTEVLNTDAEGRLILADALAWAKQYDPEIVLDFATLTGAAARAIGQTGTVFMGTANKSWRKRVKKAGKKTGERMVKFPLWDEYGEMIESQIADIQNLGGELAGACTAGKFLEHFTDYPWLHFDIAGPAYIKKAIHYRPYGATGVGVRFIYQLTKKWLNDVAEKR